MNNLLELAGILAVVVGPICMILYQVGRWGFSRILVGQNEIIRHLERVNNRLDAHDREIEYLRGATDTLNNTLRRQEKKERETS